MKYIIKNCPASQQGTCEKYGMCQNYIDCVIKQVIEKCKEHPFIDCACGDDILQLFDIEEVDK